MTTHCTINNWVLAEKHSKVEGVWTSLTCRKGWICTRVHAGGVCWSCRCITHRKSCCNKSRRKLKKSKKKKITAINNNKELLELNYTLWKLQTLPIHCMQGKQSSSLVTWVSYSFRVSIRNPWWRRAINRVHDVYLSAPWKRKTAEDIIYN